MNKVMYFYFALFIISMFLCSCNDFGNNEGGSVSSVNCGNFTLANDLVEATYQGTITVTSGTCSETYKIYSDVDYNVDASATGWRQINAYLETTQGNKNFTSGGRWQTVGSLQAESAGLTFTGVDNTTCQNAKSLDGIADLFSYQVTAEFDSNCQPRLRGTFREYSRCSDNSEVDICTGTIILTK